MFLGDFFKDPLPDADLYILARILHDWTDQRGIELLQRVHEACRPGLPIHLTGWPKEPPSKKKKKKKLKEKTADMCVCVYFSVETKLCIVNLAQIIAFLNVTNKY